MKKITCLITAFLFVISVAYGATGFKEDFNGTLNSGWKPNAFYSVSQSTGVMKINVRKTAGWQSFSLDLGANYDFSANPYANLKVRAPKGLVLSLYFADSSGKNVNKETRITGTGGSELFNDYFFDFTGTTVDLTKISSVILAVNGTALSYTGELWIDDLRLGDQAVKMANIGALPGQGYYAKTTGVKLQLSDIRNASSVQISGESSVIENVSVSAISNGLATVTFDVKDVSIASNIVSLTAKGATGYADKTTQFVVSVEQNLPPTIDSAEPIDVPSGKSYTVTLTGISDGNFTVEQPVTVTLGAVPAGITNASVKYTVGDSKAYLTFTAAKGNYQLPIQLKDNGSSNNTTNASLTIRAYDNFNNAPDFTIYDAEVYSDAGTANVFILNPTDGDNNSQTITYTASSSDPDVADVVGNIKYYQGDPTRPYVEMGVFRVGITELSVTATDNGGDGSNNGNRSTTKTIKFEVLTPPLSGYTVDFSKYNQEVANNIYKIEGEGTSSFPSIVDSTGFKSLLIRYENKGQWDGWWYRNPELDLSEHPYMSYEVFPLDDKMDTHAYFWDNYGKRNADGAHTQRKTCPKGQWTKVFLDFRDPTLLLNDQQEPINLARIDSLLFNIHPAFTYPTTTYTGRVLFRNIRLGSDVENVPTIIPKVTIDPVGETSYYAGSGLHSVTLTGITDGADGTNTPNVAVSATSGGSYLTGLTTNPSVNEKGEAIISFTVSSSAGRSTTIKVDVSVSGHTSNSITFTVNTISNDESGAVAITLDPTVTGQTIAGLGSNPAGHHIDLFVNDWGGSTVRLFLEGDDIEPVNDNSDANSLDRSKINASGLRVDYVKELAAAGVEHFFLTILSPPAWMKENLSTNWFQPAAPGYNNTTNKVPAYMFDEYVEFLVACIEVIKEETGIELAGLCIQNEPGFCEPYGSAVLDPQQASQIHVLAGKRFADRGIKTKLIYCETPWGWCQQWANALKTDTQADSYTDVFGIHYPNSNNSDWAALNATCKTKNPQEIWGAECSAAGNTWSSSLSEVNKVLIGFNNGLTHWCVFGFSGAANMSNSTNQVGSQIAMVYGNTPSKHYYAMKNIFRYVRPGDVQIKSSSGDANINIAAFECKNEGRYTILMSNNAATAKKVILPAIVKGDYKIYRSSDNEKCIEIAKTDAVSENLLILPAKSVTTLVVVNKSPLYMDRPSDMEIGLNAPLQTVILTGIGSEEPGLVISVIAESDNSSLIAGVETTYVSPEETATLTFTPIAGQMGTANITVTLSATGVESNAYTFKVTVDDIGIDVTGQSVMVYPNPATEIINYDALFDGEGWVYSVISSGGATMKSRGIPAGSTGLKVEISDLIPGWYVLRITNGKETVTQSFQKK